MENQPIGRPPPYQQRDPLSSRQTSSSQNDPPPYPQNDPPHLPPYQQNNEPQQNDSPQYQQYSPQLDRPPPYQHDPQQCQQNSIRHRNVHGGHVLFQLARSSLHPEYNLPPHQQIDPPTLRQEPVLPPPQQVAPTPPQLNPPRAEPTRFMVRIF